MPVNIFSYNFFHIKTQSIAFIVLHSGGLVQSWYCRPQASIDFENNLDLNPHLLKLYLMVEMNKHLNRFKCSRSELV